MNTKKLICFLAGATLLLSCVGCPTTPTSPPSPTPRPRPSPGPGPRSLPSGRRTETGTVQGFTSTQITLQIPGTDETWIVTRTSTLTISGTLEVGSTITVTDSPYLTQVRK